MSTNEFTENAATGSMLAAMAWRSALVVLMVAGAGVSLSLANGVTSKPAEATKPADPKQLHASNSGCQTRVDGKIVQLQPGEGIQVGKGWRTCQIYDGHPVIIHSSEPQKSTALEALN
ncbi:MAG: hypothetical protein WCP34_14945 [Pseudomonadota bacterium]